MTLVMIGVNPRRAPFPLLVRSLETTEARRAVLCQLADHRSVEEVLLLVSEERVEVYAAVEDGADAYDVVFSQLVAAGALSADGMAHGYFAEGVDAAAHLFAAVAAVDEFARPGEDAAAAFAAAASASRVQGALGPRLEGLAGAVRALSGRLGAVDADESASALGATVAELTRRVFDHLGRRRALVVGLGALPAAAASALVDAGVGHLTWVGAPSGKEASGAGLPSSKTGRAPAFPEVPAPPAVAAASPEDLPVVLGSADVVVAAPGVVPVLDKRLVKTAMRTRRGRPMLLVDVSEDAPAIEDRVASIDDAFLYNRADLVRLTNDVPWTRVSGSGLRDAVVAEAVRDFSYQLT